MSRSNHLAPDRPATQDAVPKSVRERRARRKPTAHMPRRRPALRPALDIGSARRYGPGRTTRIRHHGVHLDQAFGPSGKGGPLRRAGRRAGGMRHMAAPKPWNENGTPSCRPPSRWTSPCRPSIHHPGGSFIASSDKKRISEKAGNCGDSDCLPRNRARSAASGRQGAAVGLRFRQPETRRRSRARDQPGCQSAIHHARRL